MWHQADWQTHCLCLAHYSLDFERPVSQGTIYSWHQGHWQVNIKDHTLKAVYQGREGERDGGGLQCLDQVHTMCWMPKVKRVMSADLKYLGESRKRWQMGKKTTFPMKCNTEVKIEGRIYFIIVVWIICSRTCFSGLLHVYMMFEGQNRKQHLS